METTQAAEEFLHRTDLSFTPRKRWPKGSLPVFGLNGSILPNRQANNGMALCLWGDSGWGSLVRDGKYLDGYFADELVGACVRMIEGRDLQPAPTWVTCMASLRHPALVPNFAERLADALGLPFRPVISQTQERPEQKTMENSSFQAGNLDGSLTLTTETLRQGPVLLVDDVVDSGWTMTVAAWLLRHHGSGVVWPLALAQAGYPQ
jgi:ATP-dependent DNA helicase RecQ